MSYSKAHMIDVVRAEIRSLESDFTDDDFENASVAALADTGWSFPITGSFKYTWIRRRMKRHLVDALLLEAAKKFKVKQYNLNQRFDHYYKLIGKEDREFQAAIKENPAEFAGVSVSKMFGTVVGAGFVNDDLGRDETYDRTSLIPFYPGETN